MDNFADYFTTAADIKPRRKPEYQTVACPRCGATCEPYGGFGPAPEWLLVGKYRCCGPAFYMDPETGQEYVRTRRHLRKVGGPRGRR
jgi:hypothetical protein